MAEAMTCNLPPKNTARATARKEIIEICGSKMSFIPTATSRPIGKEKKIRLRLLPNTNRGYDLTVTSRMIKVYAPSSTNGEMNRVSASVAENTPNPSDPKDRATSEKLAA
ncbi:hypothetical protein MGR01S_19230 [Meiothermus granaticius NBRC 107808]|nr:hypothetical protein MGR01S_19230 [Meiothermus granaticius NBRC 107808]